MNMNFEGLLELARKEADAEMQAYFGPSNPYYREPARDALVVHKFLERICPVPIPEAIATMRRLRS